MGMRRTHLTLVMLLLAIGACSEDQELPAVVTDGDGFFGKPWPSDTRTIDGRPDMSNFPEQGTNPLIDDYIAEIEQLDGFGTNAPIFVPLTAAIESLPSPEETLTPGGSVMLLDIDPRSPERGQLTPVRLSQQATETTWQRSDLLAVQPVWGFPLRPRTTYALLLSKDFVSDNNSWRRGQDWTALENTLLSMRLDTAEVGYALMFTTQDPVQEMARFTARIQSDLTVPALDQELVRYWQAPQYGAYRGEVWVPMWQHGSKPYLAEGGGFAFDDDGMPLLAGWERALFTLTLPRDQAMPEAGWPIVIYGHGTGGDYRSFAAGSNMSPADQLARKGIAAFGISLPLHGDRGTAVDPALASFNYLNPASARACFRQGALDQIYLSVLLTRLQHVFSSEEGDILTDPERVAYMGHSHGGLIGAIAAPFFGEKVKATFLSGAGGGLSTTLVTRDAGDFDIQGILENALNFTEGDILTETHPVVAMVQTLAEVTDPINYAPFWSNRSPHWSTSPMHVLMTEGLNDQQTPPDTAEALAAAGRLPILSPAVNISLAHRLMDDGLDTAPLYANRETWSGKRVSTALAQYGDEDHFVIFNNPDAAALYTEFLSTALDGSSPWIQDR